MRHTVVKAYFTGPVLDLLGKKLVRPPSDDNILAKRSLVINNRSVIPDANPAINDISSERNKHNDASNHKGDQCFRRKLRTMSDRTWLFLLR